MKPNAWFHLHATTEMYFEWQGKHAGENSSNAYIVEGKVSWDWQNYNGSWGKIVFNFLIKLFQKKKKIPNQAEDSKNLMMADQVAAHWSV